MMFHILFFLQVDLRSATELGHDELIHGDVYEGFVNVGGGEHGATGVWEGPEWDEAIVEESVSSHGAAATLGGAAAVLGGAVDGEDAGSDRRRRYFVSLIDESIYKKGVFQRLRRRHKVRAVEWCTAAISGSGGVRRRRWGMVVSLGAEPRGFRDDNRADCRKPVAASLLLLSLITLA